MIKTDAEYNTSIEFLNRDMELYDFDLSKKMTSYEYNLYLQDTEYYLDFLYEKIRTLEDVINYVEDYAEKKIEAANKLIDDNIEILETAIDKYIDSNKITIKPEWNTNPLNAILDRDGTEIPIMKYDSYSGLSSSYIKIKDVNINSVTKTSNHVVYNDNIDSCLKDGYYISCYNLEHPDTIIEELTLDVDDNWNCIQWENLNCNWTGEYNNAGQIVLKLTADNVNKNYENFDYKTYSDSNLNTVKTLGFDYNQILPINNNQNNLVYFKDTESKNKYMNEILKQQKLIAEQYEKSNRLNAINKGEIWLS